MAPAEYLKNDLLSIGLCFFYNTFQVTSSAVPSGETTLKVVSPAPMVTPLNFQMTPVGSPVAASSATFSPSRYSVRLGALA